MCCLLQQAAPKSRKNLGVTLTYFILMAYVETTEKKTADKIVKAAYILQNVIIEKV